MPALTISTSASTAPPAAAGSPNHPKASWPSASSSSTSSSSSSSATRNHPTSSSPLAQSYPSPVDPTAPNTSQDTSPTSPGPAQAPPPPPPLISLTNNPDAIALRAAISILHLQKRQSRADLATLERVKRRALDAPEIFLQELRAGRIKHGRGSTGLFGDEGDGQVRSDGPTPVTVTADDDEEEEADEDTSMNDASSSSSSSSSSPSSSPNPSSTTSTIYPPLPTPQTIIRCPPINWASYSILGAPLDALHADQQRRPISGTPLRLDGNRSEAVGTTTVGGATTRGRDVEVGVGKGTQAAATAVLAAPYRPGVDPVFEGMRTRSSGLV
ncbi:MAG: hypothetical protein M1817_000723 [Caeruleum heppii]|nr:MAG: hypothetical protein M1817_000723 [Caeruleum heppii]